MSGEDTTGKCSDRAVSPTSPFDCLEGSDVAEEHFGDHATIDDACHGNGVRYSGDLPTPRGSPRLDRLTAEKAGPDMDNALSYSEDESILLTDDIDEAFEKFSKALDLEAIHYQEKSSKVTHDPIYFKGDL